MYWDRASLVTGASERSQALYIVACLAAERFMNIDTASGVRSALLRLLFDLGTPSRSKGPVQ